LLNQYRKNFYSIQIILFKPLENVLTGFTAQFNRLNRHTFDINDYNIRKNIVSGKYSDYHCLYPMTNYSELNYEIYNLLPHNTP
jgi:hypothetical protein